MKKYVDIESILDWRKLLPSLIDQNPILLNKPNDDFILAWGEKDKLIVKSGGYNAETVQSFIDAHQGDYLLGYLAYDIKNDETRKWGASLPNESENDLFIVVPEHVIINSQNTRLYFGSAKIEWINKIVENSFLRPKSLKSTSSLKLNALTSKANYLEDIVSIKKQIQNGIIYEMNYCVSFQNTFDEFDPVSTYIKLTEIAEAPFSAFVHDGSNFILSASPERFLNKKKERLLSQPIKGTAKRGANAKDDEEIKTQLVNDPKELAENVMIVDLVRNDLAKVAKKKTVNVNELCHPYSFKTVHQLISTISCELNPNISFTQILQALFPMGSMTGAPKISAITNIDKFESFRRGIYSGSVGYIDPNGNFDFNVVIRSIFADMNAKRISCGVGGAITINSSPLMEYQECLLKLKAIQNALC